MRRFARYRFIDSVRLNVKGGTGGHGNPKYGGVGGKGGDVCVVAKEGVTLKSIIDRYPAKTIKASAGDDSRAKKLIGEPGQDKVIPVPIGVSVYDEHCRLIGEVNKPGETLVIVPGGPGGSSSSLPPFCGAASIQQVITLDLKLIADIGLVGFPNAGKSTLLKAVSRARPKIASYPFTTIKPNLGVIHYPDKRQIRMADLPGLIEGASVNIGMGHKFLKHVERTRLLMLVVDIDGFRLSPLYQSRSCLETVILLNKELELYKEDLLEKPAMLVVNKMDLPGAEEKYADIKHSLQNLQSVMDEVPSKYRPNTVLSFDRIIPISAKTDKESAERVKEAVKEVLDANYEYEQREELSSKEEELLENVKKKLSERGTRTI